mmetsp:Transcript_81616/g.189557  ORF Transcript_81616/g.189557 Transcript_81616/m.189557 type:complete len:287 (-) Transcript_81616:565-1425(-)
MGVTTGNIVKLLIGPGLLLPEHVHTFAQAVSLLNDDLKLHLDIVVLAAVELPLLDQASFTLSLGVICLCDCAHPLLQGLYLHIPLLLLCLQQHDLLRHIHACFIQSVGQALLHLLNLELHGLTILVDLQLLLLEPLHLRCNAGLPVGLAAAFQGYTLVLCAYACYLVVVLNLLCPMKQPYPQVVQLLSQLLSTNLGVSCRTLALVQESVALLQLSSFSQDLRLKLCKPFFVAFAELRLLLQLLLQILIALLQLARGRSASAVLFGVTPCCQLLQHTLDASRECLQC